MERASALHLNFAAIRDIRGAIFRHFLSHHTGGEAAGRRRRCLPLSGDIEVEHERALSQDGRWVA